MSAARLNARLLVAITVFGFTVACDDDERDKKTKYEVEIYVSDDIKWEVIEMKPQGRFKKPLVEVHRPEGVAAKEVEKKKRKTIVYEFSPSDSALESWAIILLAGIWLIGRQLPHARSFLSFTPPTYQRG